MAPPNRPKKKDDAGTSGVNEAKTRIQQTGTKNKTQRNHEEALSGHGSVERHSQPKCGRHTSLKPRTWYRLQVPGSEKIAKLYLCEEKMGDVHLDKCLYPPQEDGNYLFHGTDHAAALDIIQTGIKLEEGKGYQDFSHEDGFYVHYDFEEAKSWAHEFSTQDPKKKYGAGRTCSRKRDHPAVVVFRPSKLEKDDHLDFVCNDDEKDWQDIVKYNRSGRERDWRLVGWIKRQFRKSHCVAGPISEAIGKKKFDSWKPSGYGLPNNKQLCVRTEHLAKLFRMEFLESIILYADVTDENQNKVKKMLVQ